MTPKPGSSPAPTPEFSRPVSVDTIGEEGRSLTIEANAKELAVLARRFGLEAIESLSAVLELKCQSGEIEAKGRMRASVVQTCVATAEPVPAVIDEPISLRFRPVSEPAAEVEIELRATDLDVDEHAGDAIDFGEAIAETLAVSLDPYPRAPGADETLKAAGVVREEEAGPFAALAALKEQMAKKDE